MRFARLLAAVCVFAGMATAGPIVVEPFATAQFGDGSVTPIPLTIREIPGAVGVFGFVGQLASGDDSISLEGSFKSDPFLDMSISFLDFGAPTQLIFTVAIPVVGGPYAKLTSNFNGVPPVDRQVSVDGATFDAGVGDSFPIALEPGLHLEIASCGQLLGCGPVGPASVYGTYSPAWMTGQIFIPGPGGGNLAAFTGRLDIEGSAPVPEPGAMGLAALGLGSIVWLRRRRQQAKPQLL